ncbi:MAG: hypothetical protein E7340_02960 [Clostridiales bacterium]|nr:hypothetical protein [Clostridiales bacterium]
MKKTKKNEIVRVQSVLEKDRLSIAGGVGELLISDLEKMLKDYFDFSKDIEYSITKEKSEYRVNISLLVNRVKPLNTIIKD